MSGAAAEFGRLHGSGCFVLPNAWDRGSAVMLARLGFPAIASTSAGFAFSQGQPDGGAGLAPTLAHLRDLVTATPRPVNADFENGFADEPDAVAANVTTAVATGVAGLSIEDSAGTGLYEHGLAVERVRAARAAIDATGVPVVLTARCEALLVGGPHSGLVRAPLLRLVLARLVAFAEAGADCLYAPGLATVDEIAAVVAAVAPRPVNVLVDGPDRTVAEIADLGVRRISLGSWLARAAWGGLLRAAHGITEDGSFAGLAGAPTTPDLNRTFRDR